MAIFTAVAAALTTATGIAISAGAVFSATIAIVSTAYQYHRQKQIARDAAKAEARSRAAAAKAADARKGFEIVSENPSDSLAVVYGRAKIGGTRVFSAVSDSYTPPEAKTFDIVLTNPYQEEVNEYGCAYGIKSTKVYQSIDEDPIDPENPLNSWQTSLNLPSDVPTCVRPIGADFLESNCAELGGTVKLDPADGKLYCVMPSQLTRSVKTFGENFIGGTKNEFLYTQQILCQGPISQIIDVIIDESRYLSDPELGADNFVDRNDNGDYEIAYKTAAIRVEGQYGKEARANDMMTVNFGIRKDAVFQDMAYTSTVVRLDRDHAQFSDFPVFQFLIKGKKIRDIVFSNGIYTLSETLSYSNNPALVLLDYLTDTRLGKGLPVSLINLESFYKAKNVCDIIVMENVRVGGKIYQNTLSAMDSGRGFNFGDDMNLDSEGNSVIVNESFRDLPLYECNVVLDPDTSVRENVEKILDTMGNARLLWSEGKYKLSLQYPQLLPGADPATATNDDTTLEVALDLTDDDLILDQEIQITFPSLSNKYNYCVVRFSDESRNFEESTAAWPSKVSGDKIIGIGGQLYPVTNVSSLEDVDIGNGDEYEIGFRNRLGVWQGPDNHTEMEWVTFIYEEGEYFFRGSNWETGSVYIKWNLNDSWQLHAEWGGPIIHTGAPFHCGYGKLYIKVTGYNSRNLEKSVAFALIQQSTNAEVWTTRSPAYEDFIIEHVTDEAYQEMLTIDGGIPLETEEYIEGIVDYFHAKAKAEEIVRTSRSLETFKFKYIIKDKIVEPGDYITLTTHELVGDGEEPVRVWLRVLEITVSEESLCEVTAEKFDWRQLAWNVEDNTYLPVDPTFSKYFPAPSVLRYSPPTEEFPDSSGTLTWSKVISPLLAGYNLYINRNMEMNDNNELVFQRLGEAAKDSSTYLLYNVQIGICIFGIRAVASDGRLSTMTICDPNNAITNYPVPPIPQNFQVSNTDQPNILRLSWEIPETLANGEPYLGHSSTKIHFANASGVSIEDLQYLNSVEGTEYFYAPTVMGSPVSFAIRFVNVFGMEGGWSEIKEGQVETTYDGPNEFPPAPTNVRIFTGFGYFVVQHDTPTYQGHKQTNVYLAEETEEGWVIDNNGEVIVDPSGNWVESKLRPIGEDCQTVAPSVKYGSFSDDWQTFSVTFDGTSQKYRVWVGFENHIGQQGCLADDVDTTDIMENVVGYSIEIYKSVDDVLKEMDDWFLDSDAYQHLINQLPLINSIPDLAPYELVIDKFSQLQGYSEVYSFDVANLLFNLTFDFNNVDEGFTSESELTIGETFITFEGGVDFVSPEIELRSATTDFIRVRLQREGGIEDLPVLTCLTDADPIELTGTPFKGVTRFETQYEYEFNDSDSGFITDGEIELRETSLYLKDATLIDKPDANLFLRNVTRVTARIYIETPLEEEVPEGEEPPPPFATPLTLVLNNIEYSTTSEITLDDYIEVQWTIPTTDLINTIKIIVANRICNFSISSLKLENSTQLTDISNWLLVDYPLEENEANLTQLSFAFPEGKWKVDWIALVAEGFGAIDFDYSMRIGEFQSDMEQFLGRIEEMQFQLDFGAFYTIFSYGFKETDEGFTSDGAITLNYESITVSNGTSIEKTNANVTFENTSIADALHEISGQQDTQPVHVDRVRARLRVSDDTNLNLTLTIGGASFTPRNPRVSTSVFSIVEWEIPELASFNNISLTVSNTAIDFDVDYIIFGSEVSNMLNAYITLLAGLTVTEHTVALQQINQLRLEMDDYNDQIGALDARITEANDIILDGVDARVTRTEEVLLITEQVLDGQITAVSGQVTSLMEVTTDLDENIGIQARRIDQLSITVGENEGAITSLQSVTYYNSGQISIHAQDITNLRIVTDGHTGDLTVLNELTADIDGMLRAVHEVKIDINGRVTGYGLVATEERTDFVIVADSFGIAPPSIINVSSLPATGIAGNIYRKNTDGTYWAYYTSTYTDENFNEHSVTDWFEIDVNPFYVVTAPLEDTRETTDINGNTVIERKTIAPGVYMRDAFIQKLFADEFTLGVGSIESVHIKEATIDTLHVKNWAITQIFPYYNSFGSFGCCYNWSITSPSGGYSEYSMNIEAPAGATAIVIIAAFRGSAGDDDTNLGMRCINNGSEVGHTTMSVVGGFTGSGSFVCSINNPPLQNNIKLVMYNDWGHGNIVNATASWAVFVHKR